MGCRTCRHLRMGQVLRSGQDIRALFAATTSLKHHLALVDQHSIRDWMEGPRATPEARQAALDSWTRLHP